MIGAILGFLVGVFGFFASAAVPFYAVRGKYPWWLLTPDSPTSPFGQYEPTVRAVYAVGGRFAGDVYWLGLRNVCYGLLHRLKPKVLFPVDGTYGHLRRRAWAKGKFSLWCVEGFWMLRVEYFCFRGRLYGGLFGWKVDSMVHDPSTPRQQINMEGRPVFSPLRKIGGCRGRSENG